jgi:ATP-dependent Lhr-like helicase
VLERIHAGELRCVARDTPEPSAFAHEVLNARPYAFLDDAPLEERRTQAVQTRRASDPATGAVGALDAAAIERVRAEVRPDPRDPDELHDVLVTTGFLTGDEVDAADAAVLAAASRATRVGVARAQVHWVAAERLPEVQAVFPSARLDPAIVAPPARAARSWTREAALVELLRGRMAMLGPVTAASLAASCGLETADVDAALLALEADGVVLRGLFTPGANGLEWCDRRLLARIHRHTLNRLRAEIAPSSPAEFMRFLFDWQHVGPDAKLAGAEGVRAVVAQLDGVELPARAWERDVLPARVDGYEPALLDMLCLTGEVGWARLSTGPTQIVGATPVAIFLREHTDLWLALREPLHDAQPSGGSAAARVLERLRAHGASFRHELMSACGLTGEEFGSAMRELVAAGLATSDGFAGLRMIAGAAAPPAPARLRRPDSAGRWSAMRAVDAEQHRPEAIERLAWTLLHRYGVVFRRLLAREAAAPPWRELVRVYRRLEARGEIRGGRFVSGMSGEQFARPDAVERLRELRRRGADDRLVTISAADPLNLTGLVTGVERLRAAAGNRIVYRAGVPVAAMEGDMLRSFEANEPGRAAEIAAAAAGRRVPVVSGYVGRA